MYHRFLGSDCGYVALSDGVNMQYSRSSSLGLTGYPARIFFEMTNYGRGTQTHLEKKVILEKWYSHLRAYLPVLYEKKGEEFSEKKYSGFDDPGVKESLADKIVSANAEIEKMDQEYDPVFEGIATCNTSEKNFCKCMRGVFERLDEITAIAKVIEGVNYESGMIVG
jgi:hypothetical protein